MKIGLIDADLLDKGTNFPNLALMKISSYFKAKRNEVELLFTYQPKVLEFCSDGTSVTDKSYAEELAIYIKVK